VAYSWPLRYENSGRRAFFINQESDISTVDSPTMEGIAGVTPATSGSAFEQGGPASSITGRMARGTTGRDGEFWTRVQ
jgi:hypothetical protein